MKPCPGCGRVVSGDWRYCGHCGRRLKPVERRARPRLSRPSIFELRAVFHRLWTTQVGTEGYNKHDWQELRQLLFRRTGIEL